MISPTVFLTRRAEKTMQVKLELLLFVSLVVMTGSPPVHAASNNLAATQAPQEATSQDANPVDDQEAPADSDGQQLTLESVQEAQTAMERDSSIETSVKDLLRPRYQQAIAFLNTAAQYKSLAQQYRDSLETGPEETEMLQEKLEALCSAEVARNEAAEKAAGLDSAAIQKALEIEQASLKDLNESLSETTEQRNRVVGRRSENNQRLPKAENELAETNSKLAAPDMTADPTSLGRTSERLVLEAAIVRLQNELEMLKQEQASQLIRENLLQVREKLLTRMVENSEEVFKVLESSRNTQLLTEAQTIHAEIDAIVESLPASDTDAHELAEDSQMLAMEFDQVVNDLKRISVARDDLAERLSNLNKEFDYVGQQIELGGSGEVIASLLFALRNRMFKRGDNSDLTNQLPALDAARLAELEVNQKIRNQPELEKQFATSQSDDVHRLLTTRNNLLEKLAEQYKSTISGLSAIKRDQERYSDKTTQISAYVDEQLFWIKSFSQVSTATFTELPRGISWIFQWSHWQQLGQALRQKATTKPVRFVAILLAVVLLTLARGRIIGALEYCGEQTKRISTDRYSLTTAAFFWTILLALPFPLLFFLLAWTLGQATEASETDHWMRGIALSSYDAVWITMLFGFLTAASRPNGLGIAHFGWQEKPTLSFRTEILGFAVVYIPALFLTSSTIFGGAYAASLGRVSFIVAHAWTAYLLWRFFANSKEPLATPIHTRADNMNARNRYLLCCLLVAIPLALILLAFLGYIVTAYQLSLGLLATFGFIVIGIILYSMALRWYRIKKRELALAEALEKRQSRLETATADEQQEESEEIVSVNPEDDIQLDLDSSTAQTRHLLKMIFGLGAIVTIAYFWSENIPVFRLLENYQVPLTGFSLLDLGKSVLTVIVTWIFVKNIPGMLELSVLRTMPIDNGTRYAIGRVCQYTATAIGIVLLFSILKLDWSKFGWIAAALSVGLGFGLQEVVANFVCGLILLFERPVRVGDVVTLKDMTGTVTKIQMRATTITNWDRQEIIVPNKNIITDTIVNWTLSAAVNRIVIPVGVAYGTDTEKARQIMLDVATDHPSIMDDPGPSTNFEQFADCSLTIILRAYLPDLDNRLKTITELHTEIDKRFAAENIEIAFPQMDLHFRNSMDPQVAENLAMRDIR